MANPPGVTTREFDWNQVVKEQELRENNGQPIKDIEYEFNGGKRKFYSDDRYSNAD